MIKLSLNLCLIIYFWQIQSSIFAQSDSAKVSLINAQLENNSLWFPDYGSLYQGNNFKADIYIQKRKHHYGVGFQFFKVTKNNVDRATDYNMNYSYFGLNLNYRFEINDKISLKFSVCLPILKYFDSDQYYTGSGNTYWIYSNLLKEKEIHTKPKEWFVFMPHLTMRLTNRLYFTWGLNYYVNFWKQSGSPLFNFLGSLVQYQHNSIGLIYRLYR